MFGIHRIPPKDRDAIFSSVRTKARPSGKYYTMFVLSTILASLGLVADNAPVIIGAMLIAPIMSPVVVSALAMATGSVARFRKSLDTTFQGVIIALIISTFIGLFSPIIELSSEVTARSYATLIDLFIALTAGAAGMYALIRKDVNEAIPGVAVSVSLLPPLTAVGIALSTRSFSIALGAGLLFITNLVAILFAGVVVAFLFGFRPVDRHDATFFRGSTLLSLSIMMLLAGILSTSLVQATQESRDRSIINDTLQRQVALLTGGEVTDMRFQPERERTDIQATIRSVRNLTPEEMQLLTDALAYRLEQSVDLTVSVITIQEGGRVVEEAVVEQIRQEKQSRAASDDPLRDATASSVLQDGEASASAQP